MKQTLIILVTALLSVTGFSQAFEGKIVYKNTYKSKMANVTDQQLAQMLGSIQEYYIKNGDYKSVVNGTFAQWQLYINKDNKLYNKVSNSEVLMWNDGTLNSDEVLKFELNKGVIEILGYKCDELILTCKSGVQKYYFNSNLAVNASLYVNHKFGNWYYYLSKSNSIPLKCVLESVQFNLEYVATEIKEMKLAPAIFTLPEGVKTMKGPN